ncbi:transcriptional regulator [Amycolatopsis coloradensis]|uniref:Transcriptional regulator n=1 Tax=Amycolatopsis coloradensis TaxID=76021 RepID=A0A1R0KZS8_9PSEU|nr:BTAD domain-containing putative transcriptional regulator [Amycolatopsis coloradensis]OLZ55142.1 transcriptional regulator [Amycolatopsis coloradensis]
MPSRAPLPRTARLLGRVMRGLFAAVVLTALVAGLPWALIHGVGWPLPDHLPGLDEIGSQLMTPMSARFLLNTLACLAWLLWLVFVLDLAACAADVARGARLPDLQQQTGPVRRVAAVLVGSLLVAMLGRTATAAPLTTADAAHRAGHAQVAVTAPASTAPVAQEQPRLPAEPGTERVRPPENGVHDSLWRIAQRCLGEGARWPEIWALNHGSAQPSGRTLTNPNQIHPGDTLHLPTTSPTPAPPAPPPPESTPSTPAPESAPPTPSTVTPAPSELAPAATPSATPAADPEVDRPVGGAASWGSGEVFVSLGLAAAVSALLVLTRRRRHARYRPGSGRRDDDPPVAPVVYQLRLAHLRAQHHDEDLELDAETDIATGDPATREHREPGGEDPVPRSGTAPKGTGNEARPTVFVPRVRRVIGAATPAGSVAGPATLPSVVDIALDTTSSPAGGDVATAGEGTQVALDLARVHGLGLVGPGGYAAARALLLTLLATASENAPTLRGYVPSADVARLLGVPTATTDLPTSITVVADLDTALAALDAPAPPRPAVLIASPPGNPSQQARLQHVLDNHGQHGLTALLLGQWRAGVTAYVTGGGIISATDPGLGEPLRGTRAFTLPEPATRDLLAFLRTAAPHDSTGSGITDADPSRDVLEPRQAATPPDTTSPGPPRNAVGDPRRLEITAGPPAPEPSPASYPGEEPRPHEAGTDPRPPAPLALTVFGAPALHWRLDSGQAAVEPRDLTGELSSRPLELLVFLAVHPGGVSRDLIVDALWPNEPPHNPASVLRTILSRIRRALGSATSGTVGELVVADHGRYRLDWAVVEVDFWSFAEAVTRRRAAVTDERRVDAYEAIVAHYGGDLAEGLDAGWLAAAREATRRDALDAVAALARVRVGTDPDYTLDLLETARAFDPHNELLYRDIMRLQHTLGLHDAISRTLHLLRTRLAEIDTTPTAGTVDLAERLRARSTGIPVENLSPSTAP